MKIFFFSLSLISIFCFTLQISTPSSSSYVAGVVEFHRTNSTNFVAETKANTHRFVDIITSDQTKNVDILVFPEAVLNYFSTAVYVPKPSDNITACDNKTLAALLRDISCAAKESAKYVVINVYMSTNCTEEALEKNDLRPCSKPDSSTNIYNSAIVFDRNGTIIALYRKFNLFNETGVRSPIFPDLTIFKTDFNVEFGIFICFDLIFAKPALELINKGIQHFIFPTMWFSELPFLTAVQIQQSWAYAHNVNLLASGANRPLLGNTGSGIYSGKLGALQSVMSETQLTRVLIANVPRNPGVIVTSADQSSFTDQELSNTKEGKQIPPALDIWREDIDKFRIFFLDFNKNTTQKGRICYKSACCTYNILVSDRDEKTNSISYSYAIVVFHGHRKFDEVEELLAGETVCGVIACTEFDLPQTCGMRLPGNNLIEFERWRFENLNLTMTFKRGSPMTVMPNTLTTNILALDPTIFEYYEPKNIKQNKASASIKLLQSRSDLQTFAIFSRDIHRDMYSSSASKVFQACILIIFSVLFSIFFI